MEGFLDTVADMVMERFGDGISGYTFVLPGKRAYRILREKLAERAVKVCWEPEFTTMNNLASDISGLRPANDIVLLARLFTVCREQLGEMVKDDFDSFESWGTILLNDFSGIDANLVDAARLFGNVEEHAQIEERFSDSGIDMEAEKALGAYGKKQYAEEFGRLWGNLHGIYTAYRGQLLADGMGYSGMITRMACAKAEKAGGKRYIFVGFNTFSRAEEELVKALDPAAVYWDHYSFFDRREVDAKLNPDGCGIHRIGCTVEESIRPDRYPTREIEVVGCPTDFIQCKVVRKRLAGMKDAGSETAVVLADDDLMPLVLQSIPEGMKQVNVTTGQPICNSPAYIFFKRLESIVLMQKNGHFLRQDLEFMLDYPGLSEGWKDDSGVAELRKTLSDNLMPMADASGVENGAFRRIFCDARAEGFSVGEYYAGMLSDLSAASGDEQVTEAISRMCNAIDTLTTILGRYDIALSDRLFTEMLERGFARSYIPYETEDEMSGIQITGILETRCQNFRNVFILSADDGTLPKKSQMLSFIPMNLRKEYGLPMSGDFQRMGASYFYHLVSGAEKVCILYNSNPSDTKTGEPSRFIQHLKFLVPQGTTLRFTNVTSDLKAGDIILQDFRHGVQATERILKRSFSASSINTYLTCQRRFALRYVYGIEERQTAESGFLTSDVGTAVHDTLEQLCSEGYCREKARALLTEFSTAVEPAIESVGHAFLEKRYPHMTGSGEMERVLKLMETWIRNVLEYDASHGEFTTLECERKMDTGIGGYRITMRIDRLDELPDGTYRIVDYKSGDKGTLTLRRKDAASDIAEIFRSDRKDRYKTSDPVLQTMLYGTAFPGRKVLPAVYSLPALGHEDFSPYPDTLQEPIPNDYRTEFGRQLKGVLDMICDTDSSKIYEPIENAGSNEFSGCSRCSFRLFCGY